LEVVDVLTRVPDAAFRDDLLRLAVESSASRLGQAALMAAAAQGAELNQSLFQRLVSQLDGETPPATRLACARALSRARLNPGQQRLIAARLEKLTPLEIPALFSVFDQKSLSKDVQTAVLQIVARSDRVRAALSDASIESLVATSDSSDSKAQALRKFVKSRRQGGEAEMKAVDQRVGDGEIARGRAVFYGRKANCSTCHQVQKEGGRLGPDLTQVAKRRSRRDLLEAIALPSASLARGFESYSFRTTNGRIMSGLVQRETPGILSIRTTDQRDETLRRNEIESMTPSKLSVMPAGIHKQLSDRELSDLMAYLMSLK